MHSRRSILAAPLALLAAWAVRPFCRRQQEGADGEQEFVPGTGWVLRRSDGSFDLLLGRGKNADGMFVDCNGHEFVRCFTASGEPFSVPENYLNRHRRFVDLGD